jgi:hypothetical protein
MLIEREAHLPLTNTTQYNYGVGLSVSSNFDLINRKNQINKQYEVAGAKDMLQSQEDEIRQK